MILAGQNVREGRVKRLLLRKLEVQAAQIVTKEIDAFDIRLADQNPDRTTLVASTNVVVESRARFGACAHDRPLLHQTLQDRRPIARDDLAAEHLEIDVAPFSGIRKRGAIQEIRGCHVVSVVTSPVGRNGADNR